MPNLNESNQWQDMATVLRAMAHPVRLTILDELCNGPKCVHEVQHIVDVSQPNLSQHLAALKKAKLIGSHANGPLRCYYLLCPNFVKKLIGELKKDQPIKPRSRQSIAREVCRTGDMDHAM